MRKFSALTAFIFLLYCVLGLSACGTKSLPAPTGLSVDEEAEVLVWDDLQEAIGYTVELDGKAENTRKNSYSLAGLSAGGHTLRVKARGDGKNFADSKWAELSYSKEADSGLVYKAVRNNTAYEVVGMGTAAGNVTVGNTYRGKPVVSVAAKAFNANVRLESLVLGDNVEEIGEQAFYNCRSLKSVVFGSGIRKIGAKAFQSCSSLEGIVLPDGKGVFRAVRS